MDTELKFSQPEGGKRLLSTIIETPGAIEAKSNVAELLARASLGPAEAQAEIEKLETVVNSLTMPSRFSRVKKPAESPFAAKALNPALANLTEDEYKRQTLLINLRSIKNEFPAVSYKNNFFLLLGRLEALALEIEMTKIQDDKDDEALPITVRVQGMDLELERISQVFDPSPHGLFLAESIKVNHGETVIDVGTGSGLFAIMSAKQGGKAYATEITREAVEMTKYNAALNKVTVDVREGSFFSSFEEKFDVIIANLPQKLILQKRTAKRFPIVPLGVYGGNSGNEVLLSFLDQAKAHMHPKSRMYIQVYSLTDYNDTLQKISRNYKAQQLARREFVEDDLIMQNLDGYEEWQRRGLIDFTLRDGHYYTYETAYELTLLPEKIE